MMKKIDQFTNQYSLQKTLRFKLIPVGTTAENFKANRLLEEDEHRAESYKKVKGYLDRYYKAYLDSVLPNVRLNGIGEYAELYYHPDKTAAQRQEMKKREADLRKQIAKALCGDERYKTLFSKGAVRALPDFLTDEEEISCAKEFWDFSTYFIGFFTNRENMFTDEEKSTGIANRCISDNLPRFLDNARNFSKIIKALHDKSEEINETFRGLFGVPVENMFTPDYFTFTLSQDGIDAYNQVIGGYTNSDGSKVQGLNEYINLHNQQSGKQERLPKLKPLYKQILSDSNTISFIPEKFERDNDDAVIKAINEYFTDFEICKKAEKIKGLFCRLDEYDLNGIFIRNDLSLTEVSTGAFGSWDSVRTAWEKEYDALNGFKDTEKYTESRRAAYKSNESFSVSDIDRLGNMSTENGVEERFVSAWASERIIALADAVTEKYSNSKDFLSSEYKEKTKLIENSVRIGEIKELLDSVKALEKFIKLFMGTGKEENKDDTFYGEILPCYDAICEIDKLYDKVRNYATQKPFSDEKIKLNFECSSFMSGWGTEYGTKDALIFEKEGQYYLGIVNKMFSKEEIDYLRQNADNNTAHRILYDFQKPDNKNTPRLFIRSKGTNYAPAVEKYDLPIEDVIDIYDNGYFKTEYRKENPELYKKSLIKMIDYFKLGFSKHESYCHYDFKWKDSNLYNDISEFYNDVIISCYSLNKEAINFDNLLKLASDNRIYLFQIYNKDFSASSHGNPNLHTMYFKALFDEENLKNTVFKLNGGAEMFYRKASIKYSDEVMEKGHHYNELKGKFGYPIIKDKRYTQDQFMLHIPITVNFSAEGNERINDKVRLSLKNSENNFVIGIDRGERNLIYICVIDGNGNIVEQYSLNEIINEYNGKTYGKDYHSLLDTKEKDRLDARKNWTTVENIKELKEGYISQVVHKICELVEKYDAVIAMEDLNSGFKNTRSAVEKSVYQKFEKMLIDKLNFYINKNTDAALPGGIYNAYQLTEKFESFKKMGKQNGFIFYIPAWLTSKIDPTTGFADLLYPKYESVESAKKFFEKFKRISYNSDKGYFEFEFEYSDFGAGNTDHRNRWTLCTFGERIQTFRNPDKNSEWDNRSVNLTNEFKQLFAKYSMRISGDMKNEILSRSEREFYKSLIGLLKLTLQMRNSVTGTDEDYLISPVMNSDGVFYCSKNYSGSTAPLPVDADANGAYHIAKKAMWAIEQIKQCPDGELNKVKLAISKSEWLHFLQKQ